MGDFYQSNEYDRQAQRFVIPLYTKNNLGEITYSSTGTFVEYNNNNYMIFAAHAISEDLDIRNFIFFDKDGTWQPIIKNSVTYIVLNEYDIVVIKYDFKLSHKNYFNLNRTRTANLHQKIFAWTGFPASKDKIKNSNQNEKILKEKFIHTDVNGIKYLKNQKYFTIMSIILHSDDEKIIGKYERDNVNLVYRDKDKDKDFISTGPYPSGMSGGAMYLFDKDENLQNDIHETFYFAGIGLEYYEKEHVEKNIEKNTIIGIARNKIIELLKSI